jgi:hypothetical protein
MKSTNRIDLARIDQLGQVVQHLAPQLRLVPCLQQTPPQIIYHLEVLITLNDVIVSIL